MVDFKFVRKSRIGFLLIHGLSGTPMELRYVAQRLEREGHTVYCPLLDGHSGGTKTLGASRWQDWYASVERAHEKLRAVCETVIVGGISAGGILSLILGSLSAGSRVPSISPTASLMASRTSACASWQWRRYVTGPTAHSR